MRALKSARSSADFSKLWTASALPFAADASTFLIAAALTPAVRIPPGQIDRRQQAGIRWLWRCHHDRHHHGRLATAARC
ncbi:hypothetical protein AB0C27_42435 [Nonomuraea sp. NPDC048882]|uniref:hypothetical protein n=1 Tax=Nonomuraea sp. NPDC048882 TaxID=3154347 RepID=UPI0033CE3250